MRFRFRFVPLIATVAVVALGLSLGHWQQRRAEEKTALGARLAAGNAAAPLQLGAAPLPAQQAEFRRVRVTGQFLRGWPVYLDNRPYQGRAGFYLLMPFAIAGSDLLVLVARASEPELTDEERQGVATLVAQAAHALEDSIMQRRAFEALTRIIPEADDMQRRIAETRNPAAPTIADFELVPEGYDDFTHLVRDALSQYWGGPKFTSSPMMKLRVVTDAMEANNGNATKALRAVLTVAIERLKPDGTRSLTATEWLLYNILEMKIVQGQRVRDVARKLVMSESDLYRKQRAAFEEVARIVMEMEREARSRNEKSPETPLNGA